MKRTTSNDRAIRTCPMASRGRVYLTLTTICCNRRAKLKPLQPGLLRLADWSCYHRRLARNGRNGTVLGRFVMPG
jgi:hypothetical protein